MVWELACKLSGNLHVNPKSKFLAVSQLITDYFLLLTRMGVIFLDELSCD
jgi:hypothetical protein